MLNLCRIWDIKINNNLFELLKNEITSLSKKEILRSNEYKYDNNRKAFIIAHIILRKVISRYTGLLPIDIEFQYNRYGKPYLSNKILTPLFFNLSYSNKKCVIALNDSEIGIDVEYINNTLDIYELKNLVFSQEEENYFEKIKSSQHRLKYFYNIWTRKEAYLKSLSIGLVDNLYNVSISHPINPISKGDYMIQKVDLNDNLYVCNLSFKGNCHKNILIHKNHF